MHRKLLNNRPNPGRNTKGPAVSNPEASLYWHDYETFGINPALDRPAQFAGLRTDLDLNPVGEPLVVYCKPAADSLPNPESCLVTGITPQTAFNQGLVEAEFIQQIHQEMATPNTCTVGYNNLRFDDEFTRYTLYRNFFDPYAREWQNGNSRWDLIDVVRMCFALRPDGLEWPVYDDGTPSFKLENLSAANGLTHESAHDALSDVEATIALARLLKTQQPKFYSYAFSLRQKQNVSKLLNVQDMQPIIHTSSMFPSLYGCSSIVVPVALHPYNKNGVIVYDLRYDPADLLAADEAEIRQRVFTKAADLPEGVERFHLKTVHINKSPMLAPLNTLTSAAYERMQIDQGQIDQHLAKIKAAQGLATKVQSALNSNEFEPASDPEQMLYGGFFSNDDRQRIEKIRNTAADSLAELTFTFDDQRLPELFFRYRARNWPETLSPDEQHRWQEHCHERLLHGGSITLEEFEARLQTLVGTEGLSERDIRILEELAEYGAILTG